MIDLSHLPPPDLEEIQAELVDDDGVFEPDDELLRAAELLTEVKWAFMTILNKAVMDQIPRKTLVEVLKLEEKVLDFVKMWEVD